MLGSHGWNSFSSTSQGLPQDVHWCLIERQPACDSSTLEPMLYLWMTLLPKIDTHEPWECLYLVFGICELRNQPCSAIVCGTSAALLSCPRCPPSPRWLPQGPSAAPCPPQLPLCWPTSETVSNWPNQFVADANTIVGEREWTTNRRGQYFSWYHFYANTPTLNNQKLIKRWWWNIGDRELEIRVRPVNRRCAAYSRVPHEKHNIISQCDLTKNLRESQQVEKKDLGSRFEHPWAILFFSIHIIFQNDAIYCNIFRTFSKRQIGQKCA